MIQWEQLVSWYHGISNQVWCMIQWGLFWYHELLDGPVESPQVNSNLFSWSHGTMVWIIRWSCGVPTGQQQSSFMIPWYHGIVLFKDQITYLINNPHSTEIYSLFSWNHRSVEKNSKWENSKKKIFSILVIVENSLGYEWVIGLLWFQVTYQITTYSPRILFALGETFCSVEKNSNWKNKRKRFVAHLLLRVIKW